MQTDNLVPLSQKPQILQRPNDPSANNIPQLPPLNYQSQAQHQTQQQKPQHPLPLIPNTQNQNPQKSNSPHPALIPTGISQIPDKTVITLLWKVIQRMRARGDDMTLECLLNEQKLIHLHIIAVAKGTIPIEQENDSVMYNVSNEIVNFVQKVNKVTMENFKDQNESVDIKIFSKAADILMLPGLGKFFVEKEEKKVEQQQKENQSQSQKSNNENTQRNLSVSNSKTKVQKHDKSVLGKLKVLTFNNLACIYKKKKKFGIALRSVTFALQIQQALIKDQSSQEKYDIIPTYLNKAAILSEMKRHDKAIEQILKSKKFIEKIEKEVIKQIDQADLQSDQPLKKRLQEKRYYGLYMKMIINYNMGAEKQHLKMIQSACEYYKQGKQLAITINNQYMLKQFDEILKKIIPKINGKGNKGIKMMK